MKGILVAWRKYSNCLCLPICELDNNIALLTFSVRLAPGGKKGKKRKKRTHNNKRYGATKKWYYGKEGGREREREREFR